MRGVNGILCGIALVFGVNTAFGEAIRDYYSEPGLNPFKASVSQNDTESVDPFGGTLQLHYTDISIPGNGGLDINIQRSYTNSQGELDQGGIMGVGWTMHFGRVVVPADDKDKVCSQGLWSVTTADNPSLEMPDGGRELLVLSPDSANYALITKSNWKVECTQAGFLAHKPDGTKYYIEKASYINDEVSWYTTKVEDKYGNTIDITYRNIGSYAAINDITASDGRHVEFEYVGNFLSKIKAGPNQEWQYVYESLAGDVCANCIYANLRQVIRPDGLSWQYDYNPGYPNNVAGNYSVSKVTYPHGGVTNYAYKYVTFDNTSGQKTTAVASKANSGRAIEAGTWSYNYYPASVSVSGTTRRLDRTVISGPDKTQEFVHYGYSYSANAIDALWLVGLVQKASIYSPQGALLQTQLNGWDKRIISNENFWHGRATSLDNYTYASFPTSVWTSADGSSGQTISYENYDAYGNPGVVRATSYIQQYPNHVTTKIYINNTEDWRIGIVSSETIEGVGAIEYELNALDDVESETRYGVTTSFDYKASGDLASRTDARNKAVMYGDYYRGIAKSEVNPDGTTIVREVNDNGTIRKITNGRGYSRGYEWTPVNELKSITYPKNAPVNISYNATSKVLQRGNYTETTDLDGFGRPIAVTRADSGTGESIRTTKRYDPAGRMIFQSHPNSSNGENYSYDGLGRLTRTTHPDGSFSKVDYPHPVVENYTDEVGNLTQKTFLSFGTPDNQRALIQTKIGLNYTIMQRNMNGQLLQVFQGALDPVDSQVYGYARSFTYNSKYFLETETHPELGLITYGRDEVGNLTSKKVGAQQPTIFTYDDLNRPILVNYPDATPDVQTVYNENGQVTTLSNSTSVITYDYDENDNLEQEKHTIGGHDYIVRYNINALDFTNSVIYPSGRQVSFNVDTYGRARQALPFVNNVDYHPSGQVRTLAYANGQTTAYGLNNRQFVSSIVSSGNVPTVNLGYTYYADGNLQRINNSITQSPEYQIKEMSYDELGRLAQLTAPNSGRTETFTYDPQGNIRTKLVNGQHAWAYTYQNGMVLTSVVTPDYKKRWVSYDANGNVDYLSTTDASMTQLYYETNMVYDLAGNLITGNTREDMNGNPDPQYGGSFQYAYDGHNKRVKERNTTTNATTNYIYTSGGQLLGEYPLNDIPHGKEYVYVGSQLVAAAQENQLPTANAGSDKQVVSGEIVALNGSASKDADGSIKSYEWLQVSGATVSLQDATKASTQFVAPAVSGLEELVFQLTVTDDDGEQASASVKVTVEPVNQPPVANAGQDQTVNGGAVVSLNGISSTDADGSITAYQWTQTSGPAVSLVNANSVSASFTAPILANTTTFGFELRVTDNKGDSSTDSAVVVVTDGIVPETALVTDRFRVKGFVHHQITLTGSEPVTTYFRVTGQGAVTVGGTASTDWQTYSGAVTVKLDKKGSATLEYYSVDNAGNQEAIKSEVLQ